MKRISVTGWVPRDEKETDLLTDCDLEPDSLREIIRSAVWPTKADARMQTDAAEPLKRVRITVEIDVEVLP